MSCDGRCGDVVAVDDSANDSLGTGLTLFGTTSCSCDSLCAIYNDCCHIFKETCPKDFREMERGHEGLTHEMFQSSPERKDACRDGCSLDPSADHCHTNSYRMISECVPTGKPCVEVDVYDPNKFIPVYDRRTQLHYTHLLCAKCNEISDPQPWIFSIKCWSPQVTATLDGGDIRKVLKDNQCTLQTSPAASMRKPRECFPEMIVSCPDSCSNAKLRDECEKGSSCFAGLLHNASGELQGKSFKNFFCGLCNGYPPDSLQCGKIYTHDRVAQYVKIPGTYSLTTLFEFNINVGFCFKRCPHNTMTIQNICMPFSSSSNISFRYSFTSEMNATLDSEINLSTRNLSAEKVILEKGRNIFEEQNISAVKPDVLFAPSKDHSDVIQLRVIFNAIVNVMTEDQFLSCLEKVEERIRALAYRVVLATSFQQFSVNVKVETDDNSVLLVVPGIPVSCRRDASTTDLKCVHRDTRRKTSSHLDRISAVFVILSIVCLSVRVCLQWFLPHFRSGPRRMQFSLTLALLFAFLAWFIVSHIPAFGQACKIFAVVRYYAFMATFAWMTNIAVDTWMLFRPNGQLLSPNEAATPLVVYHLLGWIGPLILSTVILMLDYLPVPHSSQPNFGPPFCWMAGTALIYYSFVPTGLLLLTNIVLFVKTSFALKKSFEDSKVTGKSQNNFVVYTKLFLFMGITWTLGFAVAFTDSTILEYIYIAVNALQGVFIFVAFACTKRTVNHFVRKYRFYSLSSRGKTANTPLASSRSQ